MAVVQAGVGHVRPEYLLLVSASLVAAGLALFIVFQAYRGYRRNDSARMAFLAVGLCLLTLVPLALSIGLTSLGQLSALEPRVYSLYLPLAIRASEIVGLCSLLYSLLITPGGSE